MNKVKKSEP